MTVHDSKAANLVDHGWELESAVERNKASARFAIPTEQERRTLVTGDHVQLLFLFADKEPDGSLIAQGERIWSLWSPSKAMSTWACCSPRR